MKPDELNQNFSIPGVLTFDAAPGGLVFAHVTTPSAEATVYLQGAHLTAWRPAGHKPVIYLSPKTELAPGKPIRGGIPVVFPWFAARHDGQSGPSHGFGRISEWQLAFAALSGEDLHLTFTLAPNELSRSLGFDHFAVAMQMRIGRTLNLDFTVANDPARDNPAAKPLTFEQALHTYYEVADATHATVSGLGGTTYIDKRDEMKHKVLPQGPLAFTGTTDRVFLDTTATCTIDDPAGKRRITVAKAGSQSTIVWNPWSTLAVTLPDMDPEGWLNMVAVETANVDRNAITLAPGSTHTMSLTVSVEELG